MSIVGNGFQSLGQMTYQASSMFKRKVSQILRFDADGSPLESIHLPEGLPRLQGLSVVGNGDDLYFYQKTLFKKNEDKIFSYNIPTGKLHTEIAESGGYDTTQTQPRLRSF